MRRDVRYCRWGGEGACFVLFFLLSLLSSWRASFFDLSERERPITV